MPTSAQSTVKGRSQTLRVVHLSTHDITGGAARAAYCIHRGLGRVGCHSTMFVRQSTSDDPTVVVYDPARDFLSRLRRRARWHRIQFDFSPYRGSRLEGWEPFSDDRSHYRDGYFRQLPPCDLVNLHWVAGFVDYQGFFASIPDTVPVVWTLHDMNAFTGGCHYNFGCERYTDVCGTCPQLGSNRSRDLAHQIWHRKRKAFAHAGKRLQLVTPSQWLAQEVRRSGLGSNLPVLVIPSSVDAEDFAPRDRRVARDVFGIRQDARVILFAAAGLDNQRKGFHLLAQALAGLHDLPNAMLVSVGRRRLPADIPMPVVDLGFIQNDRLLSLAYSAADILVIPSLQDNMPNTVLEAMACGTPVVGFAVGGISDAVRSGITGLLTPLGDIAGLRNAIADLVSSPTRLTEMAKNCRRIVLEEYTLEVQARRYVALYQTILQRMSYERTGEIVRSKNSAHSSML